MVYGKSISGRYKACKALTATVIDSLLEASPWPQLLIGPDERVLAANQLALNLLGSGVVSRHYITALRQPDLLDCIEAILSGAFGPQESRYLASEATRETSYKVVVARVETGQGPGVMASFVDVTDLQEAGQMRRDFVANVSHELRTPLTALLGFIETLRGAAKHDPVAQERFLGIMEREAARMNRLVRDLLSLSRVESEERMRPQGSVDVGALLQSTVMSLRPLADEARMELTFEGLGKPAMVRGDGDQLSQVFSNLVENAIKYGASDGTCVEVRLEKVAHEPSLRGPAVKLCVRDDGEGFDPIHIPRLTERFYRVDDHRSREMGGTGLGLAIAKHIINRHRGRLRIESSPGNGASFTVVLSLDDASSGH